MDAVKTILQNHPFFKEFTAEHVEKLVQHTSEMRFNPGQYIFRDGQEANMFYLVLSGMVSLEVYAPNRGPVTVQPIGAGDVLGWSWLYPPHRWHFDAKAKEETRVLALNGKAIRGLIEDDHEFGFQVMKRIALVMENRLQATRVKLMEVYDIYWEPDKSRPDWQKLI